MATLHGETTQALVGHHLESGWLIYWQDDTPWGFRLFRTIWTAISLEHITLFSSSSWILVCRLTLPVRILLKVKLLSMLHSGTNGWNIQTS
ncbi:hypothetical protein AVEN_219619-1 [Araneus ventricosus]|uniref:Uncharacterized protein n=1 Tax=Araneus ventricosus TaxID=182803 RepID=A0A4Y2M1W9_ARAVE|nr:hypothetical protein AVEN_219619-1 [Araneus ventricosus]